MVTLKKLDGVGVLLLLGLGFIFAGLLPDDWLQLDFYILVAFAAVMALVIWCYYLRKRNTLFRDWFRDNSSLVFFLFLSNGIALSFMLYAMNIGVFGIWRMVGAFLFSAYSVTGLALLWEFIGMALKSIWSKRNG